MYFYLKIVQQMIDKENIKFIINQDWGTVDWDIEVKLIELQKMIHVYEEHIGVLEIENKQLKAQIDFLKEQLHYKTFGKPSYEEEEK